MCILYYKCSGHSVVRIHANTEVKDGKQKLDDIKVNLHIGDLEVHMIKAQKPSSGKAMLLPKHSQA